MKTKKNDTKKVFAKCGMCSHTFYYLLNREFGFHKENEERASDPLAGGIIGHGHQCGMLWGATLAAGAEAHRRNKNPQHAVAAAVGAAQHIVEAFTKRTKSTDCRYITGCNLRNVFGMAKYLVTGKTFSCFNLAEDWTFEAIDSAKEGLLRQQTGLSQAKSCACEVARKMGASDEEAITVAGLAGGIGLSGNACGALGAAIWMKTLAWCRKNPGKSPPYFKNTAVKKSLRAFGAETGSEFLCQRICGRKFKTIDEHTGFIQNGGCAKLIDILARS